jgi:hypothetical protein
MVRGVARWRAAISAQASGCDVDISMAVSAEPSVAQVGDSVELRYTVSDPRNSAGGLQVAAALPNGLTFVSASNGGAIQPASGYIAWRAASSLESGGSTTLSIAATISGAGNLENHVCSAGRDNTGNEVMACSSTIVSARMPP